MTLTKKRRYTTMVSSEDFRVFKLSGDEYERDAGRDFSEGNYRQSALEYRNAAKCYGKALEKLGETELSTKKELEKLFNESNDLSRKSYRMAALYKVTEKNHPVLRGIIRKVKGRHILASFIISLFFTSPSITGNFVGIGGYSISLIGIFFFFLGLFLSYFLIKKNILIKDY